MNADEALGKRVADARRAAGMSEQELAGRCKLKEFYIMSLEMGSMRHPYPTWSHMVRIADALNVSLDDLAGRGKEVEF